LPSDTWLGKGLAFGLIAWVLLGFLFFPALGLGYFAAATGLGLGPALLSLAMLLSYGLAMSAVYAVLSPAAKI
jgi:hypothetical protein